MSEQEEQKVRFTKCWDTYLVRIRNYAWHLYRDRGKAEDAANEAFGKLWIKFTDEPDKVTEVSAYAWLRQVVLNDYFNWRRHNLKYPSVSLPDGGEAGRGTEIADPDPRSNPALIVERRAVIQALYECIQALPPHNRIVILLSLRRDNDQQIAEELDIPKNTVIGRRFVARRRLKHCLSEKGMLGDE